MSANLSNNKAEPQEVIMPDDTHVVKADAATGTGAQAL
jgi:hypothetical protein